MPAVGFKHSDDSLARMRAAQRAWRVAPEVRFWRLVEFDPFGGCWLWSGTLLESTGYGQIGIDGRSISAHRFSYAMFKGELVDGLMVCHRCDVRCCVNPDHLFLGTGADNMHDMIRKGRKRAPKGVEHPRAKLSDADIPEILERLACGESCRSIGDSYGVTDCAINAIRRGKSWTHVTGFASTRRAA